MLITGRQAGATTVAKTCSCSDCNPCVRGTAHAAMEPDLAVRGWPPPTAEGPVLLSRNVRPGMGAGSPSRGQLRHTKEHYHPKHSEST